MKHKKIKRKEKQKIISIIAIMIFLLSTTIVTSTSMPRGVEGTIYYPDGHTEIFSGIPVTITNLNTSEVKTAWTGIGTSGRYSIALNWEYNASIEIKVKNPHHENSTTLKLEGVIRNVDLNINMTFDNVPPNITSTPITEALAEYEYKYQVTGFDWNNDEITYSLSEAPSNMSITPEGLITWTPERTQFGNNTVIVNASDGEDYSLQEFVVYVYVINEAPNIVSEPITTVNRNELYEYAVDVVDEDYEFLEYDVFRGPEGMVFIENILTFRMDNSHEGEYIVIIDVRDMLGDLGRQIFVLGIIEPEPTSIRRTSGIEETIKILEDQKTEIITRTKIFELSKDLVVKKVVIQEEEEITLTIKETTPVEERVKTINTLAYKYFKITPNKNVTGKTIITFSVKKQWLEERGIKPEEIILKKYKDGDWKEQTTTPIKEENNEYLFEAETQGLSLFVVTHKEGVQPLPKPILIHQAKTNYLFIGEIMLIDEEEKPITLSKKETEKLNNKIRIKAENKETKETSEFETRIIGNKIIYQGSITGNIGNNVEIIISIDKKEITHLTTIKNIINEENILLKETNFTQIKTNRYIITITAIILILLSIYMIIKKLKLNESKNENEKKQ